MAKPSLNQLQNDFLREFFTRDHGFYLTGGAALVGFYLGHRETNDLDLFTSENELESGFSIAADVARSLGATIESLQTAPDHRRLLIKQDEAAIVVDLVRERVFQLNPKKKEINGVRVDSAEEILANKLCTLLSRSEIRDLVDVRELETAGFSLDDAVETAAKKDAGFSAAQLAWVLHQIRLGDDLRPPGNTSLIELNEYLDDLIKRLQKLSLPT